MHQDPGTRPVSEKDGHRRSLKLEHARQDLDALELGIVLADAVNNGKGVEEREKAVAKCEEERLEAAKELAEIANENLQASISPDAPASALKALGRFFEVPERRRKA